MKQKSLEHKNADRILASANRNTLPGLATNIEMLQRGRVISFVHLGQT